MYVALDAVRGLRALSGPPDPRPSLRCQHLCSTGLKSALHEETTPESRLTYARKRSNYDISFRTVAEDAAQTRSRVNIPIWDYL
jgi:hypothetical protein